MKKNMGPIDKAIRTLIAAVVVILYFTSVISGTLAIILLVISAVLVITSLVGVCPLYMLVRISTRNKEAEIKK